MNHLDDHVTSRDHIPSHLISEIETGLQDKNMAPANHI
jgi:hypothetical protein